MLAGQSCCIIELKQYLRLLHDSLFQSFVHSLELMAHVGCRGQ